MKRDTSFPDVIIIIDFDSTLTNCEALDELASIALAQHPRSKQITAKIKEITRLGMEGRISIGISLRRRLRLLEATRKDVATLTKLLLYSITPSFRRNASFLSNHASNIYIISNGFREYVIPVAKSLGLKPSHVLANSLCYDRRGQIVGLDPHNPLSKAGGKTKALRSLRLKQQIYVIGDGFTDLQMKSAGPNIKFIAFCENIRRAKVIKSADYVANSFEEACRQIIRDNRFLIKEP